MFDEDDHVLRWEGEYDDIPNKLHNNTGYWMGQRFEDMDISHLKNTEAFCRRKGLPGKADEIKEFLQGVDMTNVVIKKHELVISESEILELAKKKGLKIPKSGAGVYVGQERVLSVAVRFDTTEKLNEKVHTRIRKRHGKRSR
jgi:hypothetical protein